MTMTTGTLPHDQAVGCNYTVDLHCAADKHGTRVAYDTYGCRCPEARAASNRARTVRQLRAMHEGPGTIPAVGSIRRLRALAAIGWGLEALAPHLGWHWQRLGQIRSGRQQYVHRETHRAVAAVYRELADRSGSSRRSALYAERHGWLGPLWWDDDTIDDPDYQPPTRELLRPHKYDVDDVNVGRALAGHSVDLTRAERLEAVRQLREQRLGYDAIAARLGLAQRQVHRDLTDLGLVRHEEATA